MNGTHYFSFSPHPLKDLTETRALIGKARVLLDSVVVIIASATNVNY